MGDTTSAWRTADLDKSTLPPPVAAGQDPPTSLVEPGDIT